MSMTLEEIRALEYLFFGPWRAPEERLKALRQTKQRLGSMEKYKEKAAKLKGQIKGKRKKNEIAGLREKLKAAIADYKAFNGKGKKSAAGGGGVCGAQLKSGKTCTRRVRQSGSRCWQHGGGGGSAEQSKSEQKEPQAQPQATQPQATQPQAQPEAQAQSQPQAQPQAVLAYEEKIKERRKQYDKGVILPRMSGKEDTLDKISMVEGEAPEFVEWAKKQPDWWWREGQKGVHESDWFSIAYMSFVDATGKKRREERPVKNKLDALAQKRIEEAYHRANAAVVKEKWENEKAQKLPDEKKLVKAIEKAYREIMAGKYLSRMVAFPELYEKVKKEFPNLSIDRYKEVLSKLCDDVVVDLHTINYGGEVEYPAFTLPTSLGELYYVSWR